MNAETLLEMMKIVTSIVGEAVGANDVVNVATSLEQLAGVVAKAYQSAADQPIDPSKFTFEAPLGT